MFGSCFTVGSCTGATRPRPALPTPQAFRLSEELPASLLRVMARLRPLTRGALGFRAPWSRAAIGMRAVYQETAENASVVGFGYRPA